MEDARLATISPEKRKERNVSKVLFFRCVLHVKPFPVLTFSQEFGLARFKSNQVKAMKGLEYALSNLQGMYPSPAETGGKVQGKEKRGTKQFILNCCHFWQ